MVIIYGWYTDPFPSVLVPEKPQEMPDDEEEDTTAAQKAATKSPALPADVKELCGVVRWYLLQGSFP